MKIYIVFWQEWYEGGDKVMSIHSNMEDALKSFSKYTPTRQTSVILRSYTVDSNIEYADEFEHYHNEGKS